MKEHRTKALRVTTMNNVASSHKDHPDLEVDVFGGVQLLRLELELHAMEWQSPQHTPHLLEHHDCMDVLLQDTATHSCKECEKDCQRVPGVTSRAWDENPVCRTLRGCRLLSDSAKVGRCWRGVPVTQRHMARNPLQQLLYGNIGDNWANITEAIKLLILFRTDHLACRQLVSHPYLRARDPDGNTSFVFAGRRLLKQGEFDKALALSELLIQAGSDVNALNTEGRTLLTYSVQYFDEAFELTRLLVNAGATVWDGANSEAMSAFTWFLRGVIRRRRLDEDSVKTLGLLCEVMGSCPARMHAHVMRTMFRHVKCYKVLGPVFYQLKAAMMPSWRQPKDLKALARERIRAELGPQRLRTGASQLGLPRRMVGYLLLEC